MNFRLVKRIRTVSNSFAMMNFPDYALDADKIERAQIGSSVRPEMATIVDGNETVESFLARGGAITKCKATKVIEPTVRVKASRNLSNRLSTVRSIATK